MAEFLVDKLLNALADAILKNLEEEFKLVTGVKNEVNNLSSKLQIIKRMLQAVEKRKLKEKPIGIWLEKLEDVAYDVDDVLDEWNTEIQKLKLKADEDPNFVSPQLKKKVPKNLRNKVCLFLLSKCSFFKEVSVRHDIAQKIKELNGRMNLIFQEGKEFRFDKSDLKSTSEDQFKRVDTTSIFDESEVCGRESDKDTIVSQLLSSTSNANEGIRIVSIVGTGGIGKTTLAQLVYNQVKEHFQHRKWVCVSDPFDQKRIAKAILEGLGKSSNEMYELDTFLQHIKETIFGKKFLLVLDDVWTEDNTKWKPIWDSLKYGAPRSRILVTTRSQRVARMMGTNYLHPLDELRESDCWEILSQKEFLGRSKNEREKFEKIGVEISKKCKGLPLAANFLGSLLQSKDTVEQWKIVLESEIWELEEATIGLFPHIYLSYNELSTEMKRCFLYCAVFPKDFIIDVQQLIRAWLGQGYIGSIGRVGELESRGYEYFNNLAMRSFFQNFKRDEFDEAQIVSCKMHDIVHDFAQHLVNGECHTIENLDEATILSRGKVRHLRWAYIGDVDVSAMASNVGKLRSFFSDKNVALDLFRYLKRVRFLSLCLTNLEEVPRSVGNLIHLRFLDLSTNPLKVLPEEICELYNLETLDISYCDKLTQLPQRIGRLINLRHLVNWRTFSLGQFPQGLGKLTSLQTLREFKVGNGYNKFEYLRNLNQLGGDLWIEFFEVNEVDFDTTTLGNNTCIRRMTFSFWGESTNYASVTKSLQAPPNLELLNLFNYPNSNLPSWIMSLNNMRRLEIRFCNVTSLPALGKLPSLEELKLHGLDGIEFLGHEFLGITEEIPAVQVPKFPKLKKLSFLNFRNLRIWEDLREEDENIVLAVMPCLEELRLIRCYGLEMLPHRLLRKARSLKVLELACCFALDQRYRASREGWIHISHIPNVVIDEERQVPRSLRSKSCNFL